jgi:primary-amine oxidase
VIRETTMGSLHDHVVNFKVDLDVGGTNNSLLRTWTEQEEVTQPWFDDDDWGTTVVQQKIHRKLIETEDEGRLKYPENFQGGYALVNTEDKNRWGSPRGYAIHPGYNPIHAVSILLSIPIAVGSNAGTIDGRGLEADAEERQLGQV